MLARAYIERVDPEKAKQLAGAAKQFNAEMDPAKRQAQMAAFAETMKTGDLFNDMQVKAALTAYMQNADLYNELKTNAQKASGEIQKDLEARRETSKQIWSEVGQQWDDAMRSIGDALRPITDLAGQAAKGLGGTVREAADKAPGVTAAVVGVAGAAVAYRGAKPLPVVTLTPELLLDYDINFPDRASFAAVRTKVHDRKTGKKIDLTIPNPDAPQGAAAVHTERHAFASPQAAKAAATSRLETLNRHTSTSRLTMRGRADLSAEKTIALKGFKEGVDGEFLIEAVEHTFASRGWITVVTLNGGNKGKAKVGHKKKSGKKIDLVVPAPK